MKKLTFIIFMLLSIISCFSQWAAWHSIGFYYYHSFHDIQFLNGDFGIAVYIDGYGLHLIKTIDKGISWNDFGNTISGDWLNGSFTFLNSSTGYLEYGNEIDRVNLTSNSFSKVGDLPVSIDHQYGPYDYPCKIRMVNNNLGYAIFSGMNNNGVACCGLKITTNGGNSWQTKYLYTLPTGQYDIRLWDFDYSNIQNNFIIMCGYIQPTSDPYPEPCWFYSTDYGQNFILLTETDKTNEFNYICFLPSSDDFIMIAPGIVDKGIYSNGNWTKSQIAQVGYLWSGEDFPMQGLTFTNSNTGYIAANDNIMYLTGGNGGTAWFGDYGIATGGNNVYRMGSLGDKVFYADICEIYIKRITTGLNTNFDWQHGQGHIIVNGNTENTSQDPYYYLGGNTTLSLESPSTNEYYTYKTNGPDTIARFYYWGGNLNQSIDPTTNSSYVMNTNFQLNADYVSILKSTDPDIAISNSNQIKSIIDANGIINIIRETEGGGIFFTRTRHSDGHYKCDEFVPWACSGGYASTGCINPYISEIFPTQSGITINSEQNIVSAFEYPSGNNNTNILIQERGNQYNQFIWNRYMNLLTINNTQNCFPKIWSAENSSIRYAVLTHLQNVSGNNVIMARCFSGTTDAADYNLTPGENVSEYTAACNYLYDIQNGTAFTFHLHIFYRVGNTVKYMHQRFNYYGGQWHSTNMNENFVFNNIYLNIGDLDITLRNVSGTMEPVIIFKGTQQVYVKMPEPNGYGSMETETMYYPVTWIQRNSSNNWVTSQSMFSINLQNKCNLEGSNINNSYFVNYWQENYGFRVLVPLWNGNGGYSTNFNNQNFIDAKITKSTIDHPINGNYQILTINPDPLGAYVVACSSFTVSSNPNSQNPDAVSALAYADNVQYCFNLGSIIVNSNQVGFDVSGDTGIYDVSDMNNSLSSNAFWLNDGDTLIVGRSAFYLNSDSANNFYSVIYSTVLMRNSNYMPVCTLDVDTLNINDSADVEALYGYIITGYGADSFYVELQVDTLWNIDSSLIGGVSGGFSGFSSGGNSAGRPLKDYVFFKNKIKNPNNAIPTVFSLHQNYPNPFNPSTTIKYDIPKTTMVNIKIYDVLGREVTTLVNEVKQPGFYEAEFNGTNLASGVYFYRIKADKYVSVKKMVLLK